MNIYFACSITGGREFQPAYEQIVGELLKDGHKIPTAHLALPGVVDEEKIIDPREVYTRDTEWIEAADVLIAEVSVPSHGVGFEVAYALGQGKPVVCIHHADRKVSKMLSGNPAVETISYANIPEAVSRLRGWLGSHI